MLHHQTTQLCLRRETKKRREANFVLILKDRKIRHWRRHRTVVAFWSVAFFFFHPSPVTYYLLPITFKNPLIALDMLVGTM